MSDFFESLVEAAGNELATIASDGIPTSDVAGFIDTGSMIFNALVSGDLHKGVPSNKITVLAGEEATGKTFFLLGTIKHFLLTQKDARVILFETESAITKDMLVERGIDASRVAVLPISTVQEFKTQAVKILDKYIESKEKVPMLFALDSLGMLSTEKEVTDSASGSDKRDMTRAPQIRSAFRVLTLKLGRANVPLLVTNHTYTVVGAYVPTKEMGGGSGTKYSASNIIFLSKKKDRDTSNTKDVLGNFITCTLVKGRLTKENKSVTVKLSYESGLDKYYGLVDLAVKHDVFKKVSTRIELPDGSKVFEKNIYEDPEKFFTSEVIEQLNEAAHKEFMYGSSKGDSDEDVEENSEHICEAEES